MTKLASTPDSVRKAIDSYNREIVRCNDLSNRMSSARCWYAIRDDNGNWKFGHSKFVGYEGLDAITYLKHAKPNLDGRETEAHLRQWFEVVDPTHELYDCLNLKLTAFLAQFNKSPNKLSRINVCK